MRTIANKRVTREREFFRCFSDYSVIYCTVRKIPATWPKVAGIASFSVSDGENVVSSLIYRNIPFDKNSDSLYKEQKKKKKSCENSWSPFFFSLVELNITEYRRSLNFSWNEPCIIILKGPWQLFQALRDFHCKCYEFNSFNFGGIQIGSI